MCGGKVASLTVFGVGIVLVVLGCILGFAVIPGIIDDQVAENVQLVEGSDAYERWEVTPMPMKFKVYIFTVKNPDEIITGEKPEVEEVGPYVYKLHRKKLDITYNEDDDTYQYWQNSFFEFDPIDSAPLTENDKVTVLNVAQQGLFQKGELKGGLSLVGINGAWKQVFPDTDSLFHTITVDQLLFGGYSFCDPTLTYPASEVCDNVRAEDVETISLGDDGFSVFAFFKHKQNKRDGPYVVKAGIKDAKEVGEIIRWNDMEELENLWLDDNDNECNKVRGRDSSIYPPLNENDAKFEVFNTDICRIVSLSADGEATYKDVDGMVATLGVENLGNDGDKSCYCVKGVKDLYGNEECLPSGFGDLSPCTGATVVMSFPHFLYVDNATYTETVKGLNPDPKLHRTFVNLEPKTGTPLQGAKRMQFNMILRKIQFLKITYDLQNSILPILWVEEGVELPDELIDTLNQQYFSKLVAVDAVVYTLITVGAVLAVLGGALYLVKFRK